MNFSLGRTYTYDYLTTVHSNEANSHASKDTQARHDVGVILEAKVDVTAVWKDGATSLLQIKVEKIYDLPWYMYGLPCMLYVWFTLHLPWQIMFYYGVTLHRYSYNITQYD